jgi:hypothetical protein
MQAADLTLRDIGSRFTVTQPNGNRFTAFLFSLEGKAGQFEEVHFFGGGPSAFIRSGLATTEVWMSADGTSRLLMQIPEDTEVERATPQ